jgi:hypothetical protein
VLVELVVVVSAPVVVVVVLVEVVGAAVVVVGRTVEVVEVDPGLSPSVAAGSARRRGRVVVEETPSKPPALPPGRRGRHLLDRRQPLRLSTRTRRGHEPDQTSAARAQQHRDRQRRPPSIDSESQNAPARLPTR